MNLLKGDPIWAARNRARNNHQKKSGHLFLQSDLLGNSPFGLLPHSQKAVNVPTATQPHLLNRRVAIGW